MAYVLDACALIAYLRGEPGREVVAALLAGDEDCIVHAVNLSELYYRFLRSNGEAVADQAVSDLEAVGLIVREDLDPSFWKDVGKLKVSEATIALADCFAIALARREGAEVVTSDHNEFDPVAARGTCKVMFIR